MIINDIVKQNILAIATYDYRNIKCNNKLYTIHHSANAGYYATFTASIDYPHRTPVLFTWQEGARNA